ncbi:hypothetical protein FOXYSP1_00043 [Fusarium oxysporum f. sp. phaseoli]
MDNSTLHETIISSFIYKQPPPTISKLTNHFQLEDYHGVVLYPYLGEVWVAYPFSATPIICTVESGGCKWWGNCAWCSLGVMHLVGGNATLITRLGVISDKVNITVKDGILLDKDSFIYFPLPTRNVWDNVIYTYLV